ncbi:helix-turn-helix transcriptional regulator [Streptomyces sp. NPDC049910]|uniref:helix-turn-helix transcriptional regulator n=1 Tax=Streptomyces sp. NPDC049910 TaxID=3155278 RepID=UPI003440E065
MTTHVLGLVPDAVAAAIAAAAIEELAERITVTEASALARRAVSVIRRDGWHITALAHHDDPGDEMAVIAFSPAKAPPPVLRKYDLALLAGLARGYRTHEIAAQTGVPVKTIRNRIFRLRRRMGAHSSAHAVAMAYERGWMARLRPEERPRIHLPKRQIQVLGGAAAGLTNEQIGKILGISPETVARYLARAFTRLDARDRAHAVALAWQQGHLPARMFAKHPVIQRGAA